MGLNIDNAPIQGIPAATTTSELRSWLLNRNLPNVITEDGFQQNVQMLQESSLRFEETNNEFLQNSIVANTYFQTGFYYDGGINMGSNDGPTYSDTNLGLLNIDTATGIAGNTMPHIECELESYIFPIISSTLCEINLFGSELEYNKNGEDYYQALTSRGTPVSERYDPDNFGVLPPFKEQNTTNFFSHLSQYGPGGTSEALDIITKTQDQNPANNPLSWFRNNPTMYDLFISPDFDGNFMRFDATMLELTRLDNHFYGLKIDQRGYEFNNASAPDGSGIKTFYTPLQPYNDGHSDAPSTLIQNTRILEQWILGSYGSRLNRDALLLRNKFTSDNMYLSNRYGVGGIDSIEGAVSLNNDYLTLAWVQSGPRKPKSNTNYFVAQLNLSDLDPTRYAGGVLDPVVDVNFGSGMALFDDFADHVRSKRVEATDTWVPTQFAGDSGDGAMDVGNIGMLNYTQRIVNLSSSGTSATNTNIGDSIRQDTTYLKTARGTISRGSGIDSYSNDGKRPYARSWIRTDKYNASRGEKPKNYSRYDGLLRHQRLIKEGQGWSKGGSVINDVGGAHIAPNSRTDTKNFMFSLENLAWKDHALENLASHEIGPNGGRLMWFPPYIESWTENTSANWTQTDFLGRMEPIFTYKNSFRQGNLNFMMVTDYPEVLDSVVPEFKGDADMKAAQFFGGEDFDEKFRDVILDDSQWVGNKKFEADMKEVVDAGAEKASSKLPEMGAIPSNFDTIPTTLYYFSGCTEIGSRALWKWPYSPDQEGSSECSNCGRLWEGQYQAVDQSSAFLSRGGTAKIGAQTRLRAMGDYLATDEGKRFQVVVTYYKAPVRSYSSENPNHVVVVGNHGAPFPGEEPEFIDTPLSEEAIQLVNKDMNKCGPARAGRLIAGINRLVVAAESATTTTQTWYSDESAPEGRYKMDYGGDANYDDILVIKEPSSAGFGVPLQVDALPITVHLELNPDLASEEAKEQVAAEFEERKTTVRTNYTDAGKSRIPDGTFFEALQENDLFAFNNYKDNIKNFHPAFHSIHPCAFNSRMTFLNQCLRAGPSIEGTVGPNNMSFGRPPICVLRLGDYYHCKIVLNNIDFSYEQPFWDLNPEGIGAQPWIVRVSMQFFIVGGMSLSGPISQLQNAVSFNYFANTELCEMDRSNPTIPNKEVTIIDEEPPSGCPCDGTVPGHPAGTTNEACCVKEEPCVVVECSNGETFNPDTCKCEGGNQDEFESNPDNTDVFESNPDNVGETGTGTDTNTEDEVLWTGYMGSMGTMGFYNNGPQDEYYSTGDISTFESSLKFSFSLTRVGAENQYKLSYWYGSGSIGVGTAGSPGIPLGIGDGVIHHLPVFTDESGCVANKTAGCVPLKNMIKEVIIKIETYYSGWFDTNAPLYLAKYNCDDAAGIFPCPHVSVDYCVNMYSGEPYNNSTFEDCLITPVAGKTEDDNGGGRTIYP
tara:strand:+ start:5813 stop:10138 length:4326 start_codon:yes stop_codon:yes gene_type:complete